MEMAMVMALPLALAKQALYMMIYCQVCCMCLCSMCVAAEQYMLVQINASCICTALNIKFV